MAQYKTSAFNTSCPLHHVVSTKEECEIAASQVGWEYVWAVGRQKIRPAGCYWSVRFDQGIDESTWKKEAYFNMIIDPSVTSLSEDAIAGGICTITGTYSFFFVCLQPYIFLLNPLCTIVPILKRTFYKKCSLLLATSTPANENGTSSSTEAGDVEDSKRSFT